MTIDQALQRLQAAEAARLPLAALETDEALQPRVGRLVTFREQTREERESAHHIGTMRLALEAALHVELEPVLAAKIEGRLFVVDGHHRLEAHRLAGRETVLARVMPMDHLMAALVSKLVNCSERSLRMHAEQRLEAAWQYMAAITRQGSTRLPKGESIRTLAGRFGIGRGSVPRMLHALPKVRPKEWNDEALDPGTGFPRWRYVREGGLGWRDMKDQMTTEQLTQHDAERLAKKIGALMDKATPEVSRRAFEMLANEAKLAASNADTLAFLSDIAEPDSGDY